MHEHCLDGWSTGVESTVHHLAPPAVTDVPTNLLAGSQTISLIRSSLTRSERLSNFRRRGGSSNLQRGPDARLSL
jgi:hypothetical protein